MFVIKKIYDTCYIFNFHYSIHYSVFNSEVKLSGGRTENEGLLLVRSPGGVWGMVCADGFDDADATVACRQLGYRGWRWIIITKFTFFIKFYIISFMII